MAPETERAERRAVLRPEPAGLDEVVDDRDGHKDHVGLLASREPLLHGGHDCEGERDLMPAHPLELRCERAQRFARRSPAHDPQVGRLTW